MRLLSRFVAIGALAVAIANAAHAAWPDDRPIEIVVGFAPGGATDVMARAIAPFIQKHLGARLQPIIVNRPGASGEIAVTQVMRAAPDGYTIGIVNLPGFFFLPMSRKTSYQTKDVALLARIVSDPSVLVAGPNAKFADLKAVLAALKASPGSVTVGHNGPGTNGHLALLRLEKAAEVKFNVVPFNGTAQQRQALAGNHIDLAFLAASEVFQPDQQSLPKEVIAQFSTSRGSTLNSVPTTHELGFPVEMTAERGFAAPRGLPPDVFSRLQKAIEAAMKDPEYVKAAVIDAPFLAYLSGPDWEKKIDSELKIYEELASAIPK